MAEKKAAPADLERTLDALLARAPSRSAFRALTALIDAVPASRLAPILKKVNAALLAWPLGFRSMPGRWWDALASGKEEPRAVLARRRTLWAEDAEVDDRHLRTYALQVDLSPDFATFVTADAAEWQHNGGDIVLWDSRTGRPKKVLLSGREYHGEAYSVRYSPNGRWIAAAPVETKARGSLRVWDASSGALVWAQELAPSSARMAPHDDEEVAPHDDDVREMIALDFSPDNKQIWSASRRLGRLRGWDAATGKSLSELPDEAGVTALRLSPKGRLLATGSETGWLRVWDLRDQSLLAETRVGENPLWSVVFSLDGKTVASAGRTLDVWTLDGEKLVKREGHPLAARGDAIAGAFSLAALPRGVFRAATVVHGGVMVRDLPGRKVRKMKLESGIEAIRFSADGRVLLAANTGRVRLFWPKG